MTLKGAGPAGLLGWATFLQGTLFCVTMSFLVQFYGAEEHDEACCRVVVCRAGDSLQVYRRVLMCLSLQLSSLVS